MSTQSLPQTDSIQELAKFWDSHNLTDFNDELGEVMEPVFERETATTRHLQTDEVETVHDLTESRGLADENSTHVSQVDRSNR